MEEKYIRYTGVVLGLLDNWFKGKVTVSGEENLPKDHPMLFTANHFTRAETLLLPYFVHKCTGKLARSLADKNLFKGGAFTDYLLGTGTLSTDDPKRNETIIGDLLSRENNWIIYPEGNMMKNKKVMSDKGKFWLHLKDSVRTMPTGAATLAIQSQLARKDGKSTAIVPINISYYPIRPGQNRIGRLAERFAKVISPRMDEELQIEGNILIGSNMHIHFCKPIFVDEFIAKGKFVADKVPFISRDKKDEMVINHYRHKLTTAAMRSVYQHVAINLDHIFALTLYFYGGDEIHIKDLISRIYLTIQSIKKLDDYFLHDSVKLNLFKMLAGKEYPALKSIFDLARSEGIIIGDDQYEYLKINRAAFDDEYEFHNIRLKNVMKMLVNEMLLLEPVTNIVKQTAQKPREDIAQEIFDFLLKRDVENFEKDYTKYKSELSKPHDFGKPFFLKGKNNKVGVVLSHGYKASPEEVRPLAENLNAQGYSVYVVRLHGHGTSPENILNTSWLKWYDSYMRGVVALDQVCDKVIFAGFSTGGLLSLYAAAKHPTICSGIISINAALKLQDIRVRLVRVVNFWNEISDKFRGHGIKDFIEDEPENPDINYARNYIKGVSELGKLMKRVKNILAEVYLPSMIIQSKNDPIVKPQSGKIIYEKIHSKRKILVEPESSRHVIVLHEGSEQVFAEIDKFISSF